MWPGAPQWRCQERAGGPISFRANRALLGAFAQHSRAIVPRLKKRISCRGRKRRGKKKGFPLCNPWTASKAALDNSIALSAMQGRPCTRNTPPPLPSNTTTTPQPTLLLASSPPLGNCSIFYRCRHPGRLSKDNRGMMPGRGSH